MWTASSWTSSTTTPTRSRGWAWQVPLLELPQAQMVLMSATLGDVSFLAADMKARTGRDVAVVDDAVRPVPLEMEYAVEPIGELLQRLVQQGRAPVYVVHFSRRRRSSARPRC